MKKIKLLLIVTVIAVIVSGGIFIHKNRIKKEEKFTEIVEKTKDKNEEVQELTENVEKEEFIDDSVEITDEDQQNVVETKEESKSNGSASKTSTSYSKNTNSTTTKKESSSNSSTTKKEESTTTNQNSNNNSNSSNQSSSKNETTKKNPWDELGITENEYYNSPMLKWQKVTHSSFEKCQEEGEAKIADSSSGFEQYWCYEVYSYSGKKLGIMLKLS